jgi:predicted CopG family antitoxin
VVQRKLTIMVDEQVYRGLYEVVGRRRISRFIEDLVRPHVVSEDLEVGYRAMAQDEEHEAEALEWAEAQIEDAANAAR